MPRARKKATGFLLPLPASRWTLSSVIVGVLVLLSYEAVHEFAFPVIVHDASHTTIQACFTPGMGCQKRLIRILDAAKEEILVETYSFTATPLMEALVRAKKRGVSVSVIADHGQQTAPYSKIPDLQKAGIPVLYDHSVAIAHNKVMIIDHKTVVTGSYNFTNAAEHKNAENMLIIQNSTLVGQYRKNWLSRQSAASKPLKKG
ncbi:MAG: phospholipase D family protein [Alphaproteobacteria bacterium]|jgi:phosphatidylserine/phosphatidylglycerophosphate/cardiolipin synthase-like enzyme